MLFIHANRLKCFDNICIIGIDSHVGLSRILGEILHTTTVDFCDKCNWHKQITLHVQLIAKQAFSV